MRTWVFGNNVNTDEIIPGRYNITTDEKELAKHVFCEVRPDLPKNIIQGDVIIGGENFGCGSSREHAPIAIKGSGALCVIAESFARIFFRNAINIGLPILECPGIHEAVKDGDEISVDLKKGIITIKNTHQANPLPLQTNPSVLQANPLPQHANPLTLQANPLPPFVLQIVDEGGIVPYLQNHDIDELQ